MKQFFRVFRFEYGNYAKDKIFIGLTAVLLALVTAVLFFPRFKGENGGSIFAGESETPVLAVIDKTEEGGIAEFLSAAMQGYEIKPTEGDIESAKALAENGEYESIIVVTSPLEYTYVVKNMGLYDSTSAMLDELLLTRYRTMYLAQAGLTDGQISELTASAVHSDSVIVGQDQTQSFFYTYLLMFLLYMAVLMYGQFVAQSVVTEKSSRAMELLITSASPKNLIFGKILGAGCAGLTQLTVLLVWSYICFKINKSYWAGNMVISSLFGMTPALIAYTVLFFVLGFLIYAFLYGALSSLASKMEEVGTLTMPVTFLMIISFVITIGSISSGNVDNVLLKVLSFVPFSSPMAMFARIAMNTAGTVEIIISVAVLVMSDILIGYLAVAIYRIGILMYGKPPKFNELIRALKNKY
ncbi:MAG: ABC transporter permease [Candidatus Fimenecus sp.]